MEPSARREPADVIRCRIPPKRSENIETLTLKNTDYRLVHRTHKYCQVVFMCLFPGEFIPWETHSDNDQFIRVEQGKALIKLKQPDKGSKITQVVVGEDEYIVINAGVAHFVENVIKKREARSVETTEPAGSLKMYILYAGKPEHAMGTLQVRQGGEVFSVKEE